MERRTTWNEHGKAEIIALSAIMEDVYEELSQHYDITPLTEALNRLAAYEDTGLEPEEIKDLCADDVVEIARMFHRMIESGEIGHLCELLQAEQDGRLVVLDEPMLPLIWGDDDHDTVLCPNCLKDLMGGFPDALDCGTSMYQCPYCGQSINTRKALTREEAKAALEARKVGEG